MSDARVKPVEVGPYLNPAALARPEGVHITGLEVVTISGQSGTLKSSVAKELATILGINLSRRGGDLRASLRADTGEEVLGRVPIEHTRDQELDALTECEIEAAHVQQHPCIIEGRLAAIILNKVRSRHVSDPVRALSVLIVSANDAKREHRIYKRQQQKGTVTDAEVAVKTAERHESDAERWRRQYGSILQDKDPFDPSLVDTKGQFVYDLPLLIDHQQDSLTIPSDATREAVVVTILEELCNRGLISMPVGRREETA